MSEYETGFDRVFDQDHAKEFAKLRKELEALIHIVEMLALCRQHLGSAIEPNSLHQLVDVFKEHLALRLVKIYDI